ncbi:MAG: c-type cytochrome [Polyangiaceae bacterium]
MSFSRVTALGAAFLLVGVAACDGGADGTGGSGGAGGNGGAGGGTPSGEELFSGPESAALGSANNEATCATCHSNDGSQDGMPGNTMKDIAFRESFKGGDAPKLLDGVNACVTGWMGGTALTDSSAEFQAIKTYFESISDPSVTTPNAIAPEVLTNESAYEAKYGGGDPTAGAAAYAKACARCHDEALTVNVIQAPAKTSLKGYTVGRIAQQVRTSGPPPSSMMDASDTTPGPMPFFEAKDLSDTDLQNIIAHLKGQ